MTITEELSKILGIAVKKDGIKEAFQRVAPIGKPSNVDIQKILITLCNRVEALEEKYGKS